MAALAATPRPGGGGSALVGVAREDGCVELWSAGAPTSATAGKRGGAWERLACVPGREEMRGVTSLALLKQGAGKDARPRVLVAGLDGLVSLLCPVGLRRIGRADSAGGSVWAMAVRPRGEADGEEDEDVLALACEDGAVRLFVVDANGVRFHRAFQRAATQRLLCVAWRGDGGALAVGGADGCVRVYDAKSGRERARITASAKASASLGSKGLAQASEDACVWSVAFITGGAVATGDASGAVQLWDAATGSRLASFEAHEADVLALCASQSGRKLYSTGIDTKVCVYEEVRRGKGMTSWVFRGFKRPHTHDVRALALVPVAQEPLLLSAGNDARVVAHSVPHFFERHPWHPTPAPQRVPCALAPSAAASGYGAPMLLAAHPASLDIWRLRAAAASAASSLGAGAPPDHLLRIGLSGEGAKSPPPLVACAVTPDGSLAATVDGRGAVRAYALKEAGGNAGGVSARRVALRALAAAPSAQLVAVAAPATLVAAGCSGGGDGSNECKCTVSVLPRCAGPKRGGSRQLVTASFKCAPSLATLGAALTADGALWIAVADASRVHVLRLEPEGDKLAYRGALPKSGAAPTAVAFRASEDVAAAAAKAEAVARNKAKKSGKSTAAANSAASAALAALPRVPLAVGTAAGEIVVYDTEKLRLAPWSRARGGAAGCGSLGAVLFGGGGVLGLSWRPGVSSAGGELLAHSGDAVVHVNLDAHKDDLRIESERTDGGDSGDEEELQEDRSERRRKRRRNFNPPPLTPGGTSSGAPGRCEAGPGWRLVASSGASVDAQWLGHADLLSVECPWEQALEAAEVDEPIHRQRYGR